MKLIKFLTPSIFILLAFVFAFSFFNKPSLAQESTATTSADEVQQSIKDRIKKALDENLTSAQESLEQGKKRAVIGLIDSLSQNEVTVLVNQGKADAEYRHQVTYSPDISITKAGNEIESDDLAIGDYFIALGTPLSHSSLSAEKIITATFTPANINTEIIYATIQTLDLEDDTITLTGNHPKLGEFDLTSRTTLIKPDHSELDFDDLATGQKAVAVLTTNTARKTTTLSSLIVFADAPISSPTPSVTATTSATCGDNICQNVTCFGQGCPTPESPETCPADCTE